MREIVTLGHVAFLHKPVIQPRAKRWQTWLTKIFTLANVVPCLTATISAIILLNQFDQEIFLIWLYQQARFWILLAGIQDRHWSSSNKEANVIVENAFSSSFMEIWKCTDESTTKFLFHAEKDEYIDPYASAKIDPSANWLSRVLNILQKIYFVNHCHLSNNIAESIWSGDFLLWQYQQSRFQIRLAGIQDWNWSLLWGGHLKMNSPLNRNRI